jgi:hypothetical protein
MLLLRDADRDLCYENRNAETGANPGPDANQLGGIFKPMIHLNQAARLSQKSEPPLSNNGSIISNQQGESQWC